MIVVDSSALVKYILREDGWRAIGKHIREAKPLYSIDHVLKEAGNAVWKHCHLRRVIGQDDAVGLYKALLRLVEAKVIVLEPESLYLQAALRIALKQGITFYDSLYVAQAQKHGELLTSDGKQAEVATRLGIKVHLVR